MDKDASDVGMISKQGKLPLMDGLNILDLSELGEK
jgi:hypothetical protein